MKKSPSDFALLILRVVFSGLMLTHGIPKIPRLFNSPIEFANPIGLGATTSLILTLVAEVLAPIAIILGLKTKLSCIPIIITMAVAAFVVHLQDPIGNKEKALLYLVGYVAIFLMGPGSYSLDNRIKK